MGTMNHSGHKDSVTANSVRKCPQCGTVLGQKNICPVCNPQHPAGKEVPSPKNAPSGEASALPKTMSDELFSLTEQFVKNNLKNWNLNFDDFFVELEKSHSDLDYRKLLEACRRWAEIFEAVQKLISEEKSITGDVMVKAMDEFPAKYPEISEKKARELVREFASMVGMVKATDDFSAKYAALTDKEKSKLLQGFNILKDPATAHTIVMPSSVGECCLHWNIRVGDVVKKGDIIATAETVKASVEVAATEEGIVLELLVEEGAWVSARTPLCEVFKPGVGVPGDSASDPMFADKRKTPSNWLELLGKMWADYSKLKNN